MICDSDDFLEGDPRSIIRIILQSMIGICDLDDIFLYPAHSWLISDHMRCEKNHFSMWLQITIRSTRFYLNTEIYYFYVLLDSEKSNNSYKDEISHISPEYQTYTILPIFEDFKFQIERKKINSRSSSHLTPQLHKIVGD